MDQCLPPASTGRRCALRACVAGTAYLANPAAALASPCMHDQGAVRQLELQLARAVVAAHPHANVAFSPASLCTVLNVLWIGAGGKTRRLLARTLGLTESCEPSTALLRERKRDAVYRSVTSLWHAAALAVTPGFKTATQDYCNANVHPLPAANAATAINRWLASATDGKIAKVLDRVGAHVRLLLVNAVHFRARWRYPFAPAETRLQLFHTRDGSTRAASKKTPFMSQLGQFSYQATAHYQWIRLPYADSSIVMDLLMPAPGEDLAVSLSTLFVVGWSTSSPVPPPTRGSISLPKFSMAMQVPLNPVISAVGLGEVFQPGSADFSNLAIGAPQLGVDEVRQSVFLAVDEAGTEAAAATTASMVGALPSAAPAFSFTVDHPFLIAIRDTRDGATLFVSAVNDPLA
jgi:serine protease inhibitor